MNLPHRYIGMHVFSSSVCANSCLSYIDTVFDGVGVGSRDAMGPAILTEHLEAKAVHNEYF